MSEEEKLELKNLFVAKKRFVLFWCEFRGFANFCFCRFIFAGSIFLKWFSRGCLQFQTETFLCTNVLLNGSLKKVQRRERESVLQNVCACVWERERERERRRESEKCTKSARERERVEGVGRGRTAKKLHSKPTRQNRMHCKMHHARAALRTLSRRVVVGVVVGVGDGDVPRVVNFFAAAAFFAKIRL